jgi:uncharacterized BrkB/YihY/UPF0761 family membrane protein
MTRSAQIARAATTAIFYVPGVFLYRYFEHHHIPQWNDLPGVLITAFFFTAGIFAWERYLERSRERRLSV